MELPSSEACQRNRDPIWQKLAPFIAGKGLKALEVGSGTGEHGQYFCQEDPSLIWQPGDRKDYLWILEELYKNGRYPNFLRPIELDVNTEWTIPDAPYDILYTANTLHIMGWREVEQFFAKLKDLVNPTRGQVFIYGPFKYEGQFTSESNAQFDRYLRNHDPKQGIRDIEEVTSLAQAQGLALIEDHTMPANNQLLVFRSH